MKRLETMIVKMIEQDAPNTKVSIVLKVLAGFSYFFRYIVRLRNYLFDCNVLKVHQCSVPVISIGNIVAGGTGKTPFTALLAQELGRNGLRVGIVSRGYRSSLKKHEIKVACCGSGALLKPEECGDEVYLLAQKFPQGLIVAGRNRLKAAQEAIRNGAQVILLDDGFQHRRLHRDVDIVLLNGEERLGKGFFLPRGFLRDEPTRLKNADYLFINGDFAQQNDVKNMDLHYLKVQPISVKFLDNDRIWDIDKFKNQSLKKVAVFCGIANPQRFFHTINELGKTIVDQLVLADHEKISLAALQRFCIQAQQKGAEILMCTEKDFIKFKNDEIAAHLSLPLACIVIELKPCSHMQWQNFIAKIQTTIGAI